MTMVVLALLGSFVFAQSVTALPSNAVGRVEATMVPKVPVAGDDVTLFFDNLPDNGLFRLELIEVVDAGDPDVISEVMLTASSGFVAFHLPEHSGDYAVRLYLQGGPMIFQGDIFHAEEPQFALDVPFEVAPGESFLVGVSPPGRKGGLLGRRANGWGS